MVVTLSPAARKAAAGPRSPAGEPLTDQQQVQVEQLQARDAEVHAHESAHVAASGGLGGAPSFDYATGPDGQRYAVGGEVSIDTSSGATPEETIARARTIRAAATAPADPSGQDLAVASAAVRMEAEARSAIQVRRQEELRALESERAAEGATSEPVAPLGARPAATSLGDDQEPVPALAAAQEHDAGMMMAALVREQLAARGGSGHTHLETDCGFCRKAVGRYG